MPIPRQPHDPAPADQADQEAGPADQSGHARQRPSDDSLAPDRQQGISIEDGKPVRRWGDALGIERDSAPLDD